MHAPRTTTDVYFDSTPYAIFPHIRICNNNRVNMSHARVLGMNEAVVDALLLLHSRKRTSILRGEFDDNVAKVNEVQMHCEIN